jgi:tetratricopeptide (TPR) repeat protein
MVSAPIIVFLYDRTFVSGTFREAWKRHRALHASLAATWVILGFLVGVSQGRGESAGFGTGIPWTLYLLTQFPAIAHYLRLSVWPHPLVFDYPRELVRTPADALPGLAVVLAFFAGTVWGLCGTGRNPARRAFGFAGACFFAILAPSSSVVPVATEIVAEHRMYLALAPVLAVVVCGATAAAGRLGRGIGVAGWPVLAVVAVVLGLLTVSRNGDYRSELTLWQDTVAKGPSNARAHYDLGVRWLQLGKVPEAKAEFGEALRLAPDYADALVNLGNILLGEGRTGEAIADYGKAIGFKPGSAEAHDDLGIALAAAGRPDRAVGEFQEALRIRPDFAGAYCHLGNVLGAAGRLDEAVADYRQALRINPGDPAAHAGFGALLADAGRVPDARTEYEAAVRLDSSIPETHYNLANLLAQAGSLPEAIAQYGEAVRLRPGYTEAHANLGAALINAGRLPEGIVELQEAVRLNPNLAEVRRNLGTVLRAVGREDEAKAQLEEAARLQQGPDDARR